MRSAEIPGDSPLLWTGEESDADDEMEQKFSSGEESDSDSPEDEMLRNLLQLQEQLKPMKEQMDVLVADAIRSHARKQLRMESEYDSKNAPQTVGEGDAP